MLDGRLDDRRRPGLAVEVERVAPLHHAPAVVLPLLDEVGLLPEVLAVLPTQSWSALRVVGDPPGVAQSVGPRLGANSGSFTNGLSFGTP